MRPVHELKPISEDRPDDLFITCASFEDRCLGVTAVGAAYRSRETALIRFISSKPNAALDRLRKSHLDAMERYLSPRSERLAVIECERHNPFSLAEQARDRLDFWDKPAMSVTIDLSCFTRLQLLFVLKQFLGRGNFRLRLLYSKATYYASLERKELGSGYDRIVILPFNAAGEVEPLMEENVLVASLGHEGGRALNAWRYLDPRHTILIEPHSPEAPDLLAVTKRQNRVLLDKLSIGHPGFEGVPLPATDIAAARKRFVDVLQRCEERPMPRAVYFTPGGPKPIAAGFALAALRSNVSVYVADPPPTDYSAGYSVGFSGMYQYSIRVQNDASELVTLPTARS